MKKLLLLLTMILVFSSCSSATVDEQTKSFVELFYDVYSPQDTMFELYLTTMSDVVDTLTEDKTSFTESVDILSEGYQKIKSTTISEVTLDNATKTYMNEKGFSVDTLTGISAVAKSNQDFYLEAFDFLLNKLETGMANDDVDVTAIISYAVYQCELSNLYMRYDFYTINSIFAILSKSEVDYVRSYFDKHSIVYDVDEVEWQNSSKKALEKAENVWEEIGEFVEEA